jgi:uncharacterized damage-inducible protein DinB
MTPSPSNPIVFLWDYMIHADQQMLTAAATLTDQAYHQEQGISLGSVEKLLDHVIAAQEAWIDRLEGRDLPFPAFVGGPPAQLTPRWNQIHARLQNFASRQTPDSLQNTVTGRTRLGVQFQLPVWQCMLHLADHSTYHRGQLNSMIKRAGGTPSEVMLTRYALQSAG